MDGTGADQRGICLYVPICFPCISLDIVLAKGCGPLKRHDLLVRDLGNSTFSFSLTHFRGLP